MILDIALYIYIAGILVITICQCWVFSKSIKALKSASSFLFLFIDAMKDTVKASLWPVLLPLTLIQMCFLKGTLDDANELMAENLGIDLEDDGGK